MKGWLRVRLPRCHVGLKKKKPPHRQNPGKGGFSFDMARTRDPIRSSIKRQLQLRLIN
jgi:hypothetical protein